MNIDYDNAHNIEQLLHTVYYRSALSQSCSRISTVSIVVTRHQQARMAKGTQRHWTGFRRLEDEVQKVKNIQQAGFPDGHPL
jgi:hypothetical protein